MFHGTIIAVCCAMQVAALAEEPDPEKTAAEMISPETQAAIDRGLAYLAIQQREDGTFGSRDYDRNVAVCALVGMAFISGGSTPDRGPYGMEVSRCVDYILEHTKDSGFIVVEGASSHGPMYEHGFATLFLAEISGMSRHRDLREKLTKAVALIVSTQNAEGGWRYDPIPNEADISVTVCQIMALRAARNTGIRVPAQTIDRAIDYVKRCQNSDGGFMYMASGGDSEFPRSAAAVVALYSAGIYEGPVLERGLDYIETYIPRSTAFSRENHYFYGHYYAIQAMWHAGGQRWAKWYPAIRDALLERQSEDGSWMDQSISPVYGTAMACIILQIPNNYLPIFQR